MGKPFSWVEKKSPLGKLSPEKKKGVECGAVERMVTRRSLD